MDNTTLIIVILVVLIFSAAAFMAEDAGGDLPGQLTVLSCLGTSYSPSCFVNSQSESVPTG